MVKVLDQEPNMPDIEPPSLKEKSPSRSQNKGVLSPSLPGKSVSDIKNSEIRQRKQKAQKT